MAAKDVKFGRDARERILAGVDTLEDAFTRIAAEFHVLGSHLKFLLNCVSGGGLRQ